MDTTERRGRIAFVIPHLGPGGAQRVAATAANAFVERGLDVHIATILDGPPDAYSLHPEIRRHRRGNPKPMARAYPLTEQELRSRSLPRKAAAFAVSTVRRAVSFELQLTQRARWLRRTLIDIQPDTVISFLTQTNILTIIATRGLHVRTVVSERNDPRLQRHRPRVNLMRRLLYRWSDVVTANTRGAVLALEKFVPKEKLAFLPNPLVLPACEAIKFPAPTFITVTRLVDQKAVDILLKASARAFLRLPEWRLAIVGDGPQRLELQSLANELGIAERVDWFGQVDNPVRYLRGAKFFVLTSRFEGSPNALLEAMACGLPAIVSDASPGPLELVGENEAGLVVPVEDVDATAQAMLKLAEDAELRDVLGAKANERTRIHHLDNALAVWRKLLDA